jgi:hypothetical protein
MLERLAVESGADAQTLGHEQQFVEAVKLGQSQLEGGEYLAHEEVVFASNR